MQDKIFYASSFGFVLGIGVSSLYSIDFYLGFLVLLIGSALGAFFILVSKNRWGIISCIFLIFISLGILRFDLALSNEPKYLNTKLDTKISFKGLLIDEPEIRETNQKLRIEIDEMGEKARVLVTTDFSENYKYGDVLEFSGRLEKPENFLTDQGRDFDYVNYLRKDGIYFLSFYPDIEKLDSGQGNWLRGGLFFIKDKFVEKINEHVKSPESLLMSGLILGERSAFSEDLRHDFINTGTIHIVALSGHNVTLVAEWFMRIFSNFPFAVGILAGIFSIFIFVLMTGASSTAVRAGVMASLALFARIISRSYDVSRALIVAGVFMMLVNPFVLVFDVSFQLSFIATVAVIYYSPRIEKYFSFVTKNFKLRDVVTVTSAAYIFVLPFILYKMGNLSLVALPANVLILPFIPATMFFGFLTGALGLIWYVLAVPFGFIAYILLYYELLVVDVLAKIPFSALFIPKFPLIFVLVIYVYFIYFLFGESIKKFFTEPL